MLLAKIKEALSSLYEDVQETPEAVTEVEAEEVAADAGVAEEPSAEVVEEVAPVEPAEEPEVETVPVEAEPEHEPGEQQTAEAEKKEEEDHGIMISD